MEATDNPKRLVDVSQEYIICSAIWFDDSKVYVHQPKNIKTGFVICGQRHHNCFMTMAILADNQERLKYEKTLGFLTNYNNFVDRKEGGEIAYRTGQTTTLKNELYSEDIFYNWEIAHIKQ